MKNTIDKTEINNLVKLIGQGHEEAFELLYIKMKNFLHYFLLSRCLDKNEIEDIISSTFLVVIKKSKTKIFYKNCFGWIISIAKYQMLNTNRRTIKINYNSEITDNASVKINQTHISLKHAMDELDTQSKTILNYIYYNDLKQNEICKLLNMSKSTFKRRKNQILQSLKEKIKDE